MVIENKTKTKKVANRVLKFIFKKGVKDIIGYVLLPGIGLAMMGSDSSDLIDGIKEMMTLSSDNDNIV